MKTKLLLIGCLLLVMNACSDADTLGDEPPVEVPVSGTPTFANGIAELLDLKCGYCHAYPLPDLAPNNIIDDLDLTVYATRTEGGKVIRGADAIGRFLQDGILDHAVNLYTDTRVFPPEPIDMRQMPLDYGTPVTDAEKQALMAWATSGSPLDDQPITLDGDADAGLLLWGNCNSCHGFFADGNAVDDRLAGPALTHETTTIAKIKSMWLWGQALEGTGVEPLSDQGAADLRAFIFSLLSDNAIDQGQ